MNTPIELQKAQDTDRKIIVDCLITNEKGEIFAQKRSANRKKFPNCWDLPGGSVEEGETIIDAAKREINEELNFEVIEILGLVKVFDYELPESMRDGVENYKQRLVVIKIKVKDHSNPTLEEGKVTSFDWFNKNNLHVLLEGREDKTEGYDYIYKTVKEGLDL